MDDYYNSDLVKHDLEHRLRVNQIAQMIPEFPHIALGIPETIGMRSGRAELAHGFAAAFDEHGIPIEIVFVNPTAPPKNPQIIGPTNAVTASARYADGATVEYSAVWSD